MAGRLGVLAAAEPTTEGGPPGRTLQPCYRPGCESRPQTLQLPGSRACAPNYSFLFYVYAGSASMSVCAPHRFLVPTEAEEGTGSLGHCKQPRGGWERNPNPPVEEPVLLPTELSLQSVPRMNCTEMCGKLQEREELVKGDAPDLPSGLAPTEH